MIDGSFQVLMPLESSSPVPALMNSTGTSVVSGEQTDFLQLMLASLNTMSSNDAEQLADSEFAFVVPPAETGTTGENADSVVVQPEFTIEGAPVMMFMEQEPSMLPVEGQFVPMEEMNATVSEEMLVPGESMSDGILSAEQQVILSDETVTSSDAFMVREPVVESDEPQSQLQGQSNPEQRVVNEYQEYVSFSDTQTQTEATGDSEKTTSAPVQEKVSKEETSVRTEVFVPQDVNSALKEEVDLKRQQMFDILPDKATVEYETSLLDDVPETGQEALYDISAEMEKLRLQNKTFEPFSTFNSTVDSNATHSEQVGVNSTMAIENATTDMRNSFGSDASMLNEEGQRDVAFAAREADLAHTESKFEERIRQVSEAQAISQQLIKAASLRQGNNVSELTVKLEPEYLGKLTIQVSMEENSMLTKIGTDNGYTRDLLANNLAVVKNAMTDAGIQMDNIEIVFDESSADLNQFQEESMNKDGNAKSQNKFNLPGFDAMLNGSMAADDFNVINSLTEEMYQVNYLA